MHVIRVPAVEAEAQRHLVRDQGELQEEAIQHCDRIRKLLRTVGCNLEGDIATRLMKGEICCHDGNPRGLSRECRRLALAEQQFAVLEKDLVKQLPELAQKRIAELQRLMAVAPVGATRLVLELF
jgi:transposase